MPRTALARQAELDPLLSPERLALAEVIDSVAAIEREIAETGEAITEGEDSLQVASVALREATEALDRARPRPASTFTPMARPRGAFWGEADQAAHEIALDTPPLPIADAKAMVDAATDAQDSADQRLSYHKQRLGRLEQALRLKRVVLDDAVRVVVRSEPALAALVAESKRLATRSAAAIMAFQTATNTDVIQVGSPFYGYDRASTYHEDYDGWAMSRSWRAALEGLRADAATPLPMIHGGDA